MQLFGRSDRVGGNIGWRGLIWNLALLKELQYSMQRQKLEGHGPDACKSNPNKIFANCNHDFNGLIRIQRSW